MRHAPLLPAAALLAALALADPASAQGAGLPAPQASPAASVTQVVGLTEIAVDYHRPGVKGRTLWGGLVPWNQVWRAGANENTTVRFGDAVTIEGQPLPAGTYGLHMIPRPDRWTVIFSEATHAWGSFFYDPAEDALRVDVEPTEGPFEERLRFVIDPLADDEALLELRWGTLRLPIHVGIDLEQVTYERIADEYLHGLTAFNGESWSKAARWCVDHGRNLEQALAWSDESIERGKNFSNVSLKAQILGQLGRTAEAAPLKQEAWTVATEDELTEMGGQLMARSQYADAMAIFRLSTQRNPDSWKAYDLLGEACRKAGRTADAIAAYGKALELARDDDAHERIAATLQDLKDA